VESAYYRTVYLFICNEEGCRNKDHSIRIFRNQLPFENKYYSEKEDGELVRKGDNPVMPMEYILTKNTWNIDTVIVDPEENKQIEEAVKLLAQTGDADDESDEDGQSKTSEDYRHENELIKNYLEEEKNDDFKEMGADFISMANDLERAQKDDKWNRFIKFTESHQNQVLRYCRSEATEPLWISDLKVPDISNIPACKVCGSKRVFEFQINCQILYYVKELTLLDWGVIAVYTCKNSCQKTEEEYVEEYAVIQLNAQELQLDEKALKEIMSAPRENKGDTDGNGEKKKKKKKKNKKKKEEKPAEESKGSDDEDDEDDWGEEEVVEKLTKAQDEKIVEATQEEENLSESDWM